MKSETAENIVQIENSIKRELTQKEEIWCIDMIETFDESVKNIVHILNNNEID